MKSKLISIISAITLLMAVTPAHAQEENGFKKFNVREDFTDEQGKAVPQGNYKVVVEATLFFDSDIIYSGTFSTKDTAGDIKLASTLTKEDEQHKNMVTNVKAVLK